MKQITYTDMQEMIEKGRYNGVFRGQYIACIYGAGYAVLDTSRGYAITARFPTKERAKRFLDRIGEYKGEIENE